MTEKGKAFLEKVSSDEAFRTELGTILMGVDNADQMPLVYEFAKKKGYDLTEEDFKVEDGDIEMNELETISGGGGCGCYVGGGGSGDGLKCVCVLGGCGFIKGEDRPSQGFCFCASAGAGATRIH